MMNKVNFAIQQYFNIVKFVYSFLKNTY